MSALKFLNLKSFHPTNKANQRRLFIAQEKEKERLKREAEARKEIEMEQELYESRLLALQALHSKESQQSKNSMMKRKAELTNAAETTSQTADASLGEHKRKRKRARKKKGNVNTENNDINNNDNESKSMEELIKADIDAQQLRFMYNAPPGLKAALDKELEEKKKQTEGQQKLEEEGYIPKHMIPDEVKFPILKNAPVQGTYTENMKLKHKPFGITLRDVKCTRCGNYGHTNIDRECPLRDKLPVDEKKLAYQDPLFMMQQREEKLNQASSNTSVSHQVKEEEEDPEEALEKMTEKEKRDLIKKYKKLKKAEKKEKKRQKKERREEKRKRHDTESELSEEETSKKRRRHEEPREHRDRYHHHHSHYSEREEGRHGYHRE